MDIELTQACLDKPLFLRLAKDYVKTLSQYDQEIRWDEVTWNSVSWRAKLIMEDRTVQGFIITETVPFDFYPPAFYVQEIYVVPESRKRGIGMAALKEAMKNYSGDVFLYILKDNYEARLFWATVEAELEWKRIKRPEINEEEGCELRVYQTR